MSEKDLLKEINLNKAYLETMVNDCREALQDKEVYAQSCRLDTLIVEYMRNFKSKKKCACN